MTLRYRMESEIPPIVPLRLKIEINTREHFAVYDVLSRKMAIDSPWFEGRADIRTYAFDELLATKLRALYQRKKGRDLYDLWIGLTMQDADPGRIVKAFRQYMEHEGSKVSRAVIERNLAEKLSSRRFHEDLEPLLATAIRYDANKAAQVVSERLLSLL